MHPNVQLIRDFYEGFKQRDAGRMVACYVPDVEFSDPMFPLLRGEQVFAMWRMLTERARDFEIEAKDIEADDASGKAHWEARYTFSKTGRPVHNIVESQFTFRDGKIVRHADSFNLREWAKMALGFKGRVIGLVPPLHGALRREAARGLETYMRGVLNEA